MLATFDAFLIKACLGLGLNLVKPTKTIPIPTIKNLFELCRFLISFSVVSTFLLLILIDD
jgi:hypothetical protein